MKKPFLFVACVIFISSLSSCGLKETTENPKINAENPTTRSANIRNNGNSNKVGFTGTGNQEKPIQWVLHTNKELGVSIKQPLAVPISCGAIQSTELEVTVEAGKISFIPKEKACRSDSNTISFSIIDLKNSTIEQYADKFSWKSGKCVVSKYENKLRWAFHKEYALTEDYVIPVFEFKWIGEPDGLTDCETLNMSGFIYNKKHHKMLEFSLGSSDPTIASNEILAEMKASFHFLPNDNR